MGLVWSLIGYLTRSGAEDDVIDPKTGLTQRQKNLLSESWSLMGNRKSQKKYGVAIFIHLFRVFPAQQDFFPLFKDKSLEELREMSGMRAHATTFMYQLGAFIDNLDDTDVLMGLFDKLARSHKKRGIGTKQFEELRSTFGKFLDEELGSPATDEVKEAWDKLFCKLCSVIKDVEEEE